MVRIVNDNGTVSISNEVFTNIAGDAATKCFGVKGMVGKSKENGLYQLLRRESMGKGVFVSFGDDGAVSVALHIAEVLFLAMVREPYAITMAFLLLVIKGALLFRMARIDGENRP